MRGRTALGILSALFVCHGLLGCGFHGEAAPVASNDQIKTKTSVSPPFASAVQRPSQVSTTPTVSPVVSASMPVPTPSVATSASTAPTGDTPPSDDLDEVGKVGLGTGPGNARKANKLVTKLTPAKVDGSVAADAVTRVLRREMAAIRKCYEDSKKDAKLGGGTIGVEFSIDTKGAVKDAKESGSTLKGGKVGACVTALVGKLTFPAAEGKDAKVTSSVLFTPMKSTVNGKELADATADDVKAALKAAGWTDIVATPPKEGTSPVVITAKKGEKTVTITFSPGKKGEKDKPLTDDAKKKLLEEGIVLEDDGVVLAIAIDKDKNASDELLLQIVKLEAPAEAK